MDWRIAKLLSLLPLEPNQLYMKTSKTNANFIDLQSFVIRDGLASWILLTNLVTQLQFQTIYIDRSLLREQCTAEWRRESQTHTAEQNLDWRVRPRQTLQDCRLLLEEVYQNRRQHHTCKKKTEKIIVFDVNCGNFFSYPGTP